MCEVTRPDPREMAFSSLQCVPVSMGCARVDPKVMAAVSALLVTLAPGVTRVSGLGQEELRRHFQGRGVATGMEGNRMGRGQSGDHGSGLSDSHVA